MSAFGLDLTRLTDVQLKRLRDGWQRVFGRYYTMDTSVMTAIKEIDDELKRRANGKCTCRDMDNVPF